VRRQLWRASHVNAACIGARPSPVRARISLALEFGKGAEHGEMPALRRHGVGRASASDLKPAPVLAATVPGHQIPPFSEAEG
jgi:hypothetical protein